ncbi:hypothetical protein STEG23_001154 [Scotinomys teguina]
MGLLCLSRQNQQARKVLSVETELCSRLVPQEPAWKLSKAPGLTRQCSHSKCAKSPMHRPDEGNPFLPFRELGPEQCSPTGSEVPTPNFKLLDRMQIPGTLKLREKTEENDLVSMFGNMDTTTDP